MGEIYKKREYALLLLSQGALSLGESFRFIAVTLLLFNITGSGVSTATGLIVSALPSIVFSSFAGTLGDMINNKHLMAFTDFVRSGVLLYFVFVDSITEIYVLLVFIAILDLFYGPARKKIILSVCGREGVLRANSVITGLSGAAYLVGPLLAGILTDKYGPGPSFCISSITAVISAAALMCIKMTESDSAVPGKKTTAKNRSLLKYKKNKNSVLGTIVYETAKGFSYCRSSFQVKLIILAGFISGFCIISINMAFYPFAFDTLKMTGKGWSFLISIYYGSNLLSMFLIRFIATKNNYTMWKFISSGYILTSVIWLSYGFTQNICLVYVLQLFEGVILTISGIFLGTLPQVVSAKGYVARVTGINDIVSNTAKIGGLAVSYILMMFESYRSVFYICSIILLSFSISLLYLLRKKYT